MGQRATDITPYEYIRRVRDEWTELPPDCRYVAWAIAFRCDDDCHCWPSYQRLADDTGLARWTVIRHVARLKAEGLLVVIPRASGHGSQSNGYRLTYPQTSVDNVRHLVTQNGYLGTQDDSLGGHTEWPRSTYPTKNPRSAREAIDALAKRHRLP